MFQRQAVVALTVDLPAEGVARGTVDTIVHVCGPDAYEVEFTDDDDRTYALATLRADQLIAADPTAGAAPAPTSSPAGRPIHLPTPAGPA